MHLFNLDRRNRPILRKASAHGLGHLTDPYPESDAPEGIPPPTVPLKSMGVRRWQYDLWYKILEAATAGQPDCVPLNWHPALHNPAAIRYTASSPQLLAWLDRWNARKPYHEQVRPFGFLLSFMPRTGVFAPLPVTEIEEVRRGRPRAQDTPAPLAPFDGNPSNAVSRCFDRVTGKSIRHDQLKTYAEALAQYHLSCEGKFENGDFLDSGRTERRHVTATGFDWIGKEANRVGESGDSNPVHTAIAVFSPDG